LPGIDATVFATGAAVLLVVVLGSEAVSVGEQALKPIRVAKVRDILKGLNEEGSIEYIPKGNIFSYLGKNLPSWQVLKAISNRWGRIK
jgi:hypothetical protein